MIRQINKQHLAAAIASEGRVTSSELYKMFRGKGKEDATHRANNRAIEKTLKTLETDCVIARKGPFWEYVL